MRAVKRFESGMVVNPITIAPDAPLGDAQALMKNNRISGIPVVENSGRLVGILTNRDVRFAENPEQPVRELMTSDNLATVKLGTSGDEARRLLHQRRVAALHPQPEVICLTLFVERESAQPSHDAAAFVIGVHCDIHPLPDYQHAITYFSRPHQRDLRRDAP